MAMVVNLYYFQCTKRKFLAKMSSLAGGRFIRFCICTCFILMVVLGTAYNGVDWNHHMLDIQAKMKVTYNSFQPDGENVSDANRIKKDWKFSNFNLDGWKNETLEMPLLSMEGYFSEIHPGIFCFIDGTEIKISSKNKHCVCRFNYFGPDCGIPDSVWYGHFKQFANNINASGLVRRTAPRRIVQTLVVNHEFEFFEARIRHHADVVDAYVILESNYSAHGDKKSMEFLPKLIDGWLAEFQNKFLYIFLSFFHKGGRSNGWFADSYPRTYLGEQGLPRINNLKEDDLVVYSDADEIPDKAVLFFLKLYDGYTEPIKLSYRWTVFGYYWLSHQGGEEKLTTVVAVCTVGMMKEVFQNDTWALRSLGHTKTQYRERMDGYEGVVKEWTAGVKGHYAGYHCSWCFSAEGIKRKLMSAQAEDKPRWGDYEDRLDLDYIRRLIQTGTWFDNVGRFSAVKYAPEYAFKFAKDFEKLLIPP